MYGFYCVYKKKVLKKVGVVDEGIGYYFFNFIRNYKLCCKREYGI